MEGPIGIPFEFADLALGTPATCRRGLDGGLFGMVEDQIEHAQQIPNAGGAGGADQGGRETGSIKKPAKRHLDDGETPPPGDLIEDTE